MYFINIYIFYTKYICIYTYRVFDIYSKAWSELYKAGDLSRLYGEWVNGGITFVPYTTADFPRQNTTAMGLGGWAGPNRRWKHSMTLGDPYEVTVKGVTVYYQDMIMFGGHRIWHGYDVLNSQDNNWDVTNQFPEGGYLDDMWVYKKELDFVTIPAQGRKSTYGRWRQVNATKQTRSTYILGESAYSERNDKEDYIIWPPSRSGHGSAFDSEKGLYYLFGGYRTYFPYLSTDGEGSGAGTSSILSGGFVPYPSYNYYLNDVWQYNFSSGLWTELNPPSNTPVPDGRSDMTCNLVLKTFSPNTPYAITIRLLVIHGGFANNAYYDDMWYFNLSTNTWLEKKRFVIPQYPPSCTDDIKYIRENKNCTHMFFSKPLERMGIYPFDVLPYDQQQYYWPDRHNGPYWNILPLGQKGSEGAIFHEHHFKFAPVGTPEFPYAATGPMQWARTFLYQYNETVTATLVERCTSVWGEPTRGFVLDGLAGRAWEPIRIAQARRQRPGWDGCRDRSDNRTDLPKELQYDKPTPRAGHRAVYIPSTQEMLFFGGIGYANKPGYLTGVPGPDDDGQYDAPQPKNTSFSYPVGVKDDLWYFNFDHCINNCSFRGFCEFGFCKCFPGFYGVDCSNTSCPGTTCWYEEDQDQRCVHACQAGYRHRDNDTYVQDIAKVPCTRENSDPNNPSMYTAEINGICDGFGRTMCNPPFVGDDCSTRDCRMTNVTNPPGTSGGASPILNSTCSYNGWCSIEYPVSRCMCDPGYFGDICQYKLCLNNCSYPNGVCNITTGQCMCRYLYNPYNNTAKIFSDPLTGQYRTWEGEDCSYLFAYSAATHSVGFNAISLLAVVLCLAGLSTLLAWQEDMLNLTLNLNTHREDGK